MAGPSPMRVCGAGCEAEQSDTGSPGQTPEVTGNSSARRDGPRSGQGGEMAEGQAAVYVIFGILPL